MKMKYNGLAPITNIYGDWKNGDVKEIPDGVNLIGFEKVTEQKPETTFKKRKWTRKEKLSDKMERKNFYFEESED